MNTISQALPIGPASPTTRIIYILLLKIVTVAAKPTIPNLTNSREKNKQKIHIGLSTSCRFLEVTVGAIRISAVHATRRARKLMRFTHPTSLANA